MPFYVPLIIRGRIIDDRDIEFGGRRGSVKFTSCDVRKHLSQLVLGAPSQLNDLYQLRFDDILDYLEALGQALSLNRNAHLQEAKELTIQTSGLSKEIVHSFYSKLPDLFSRNFVREFAENGVGIRYLDGWVERKMNSGCVVNIRAFGARAVHVLAGNVPFPSSLGVVRNAILRSDAIFKTPSNDPITAAAIARTMIELDPMHPITRHLSVAYWKGGDEEVESYLYDPTRIEKIIAWGGFTSIMHISKYIQPGIDLITMDPKLSSSIIGRAAFVNEATMREVAERAALDIGCFNQQACSSARVIYVETGTDSGGLQTANRFGQMVYDAIQALPPTVSGPAPAITQALHEELQSLRLLSEQHRFFGGGRDGAIIVSQTSDPVDFARLLNDRVANLVPVDDLEIPIQSVTAYTQTIGIYPDAVKKEIRDRLVFNGAQRIVSLGYSSKAALAGPSDGMEPLRRMCKWISDETNDPEIVKLPSRV